MNRISFQVNYFQFFVLKIMKKETNYERYGNYIINRGDSLGSGTFGKVYKGYQIISENSFGNYERLRLEPIAIK